MDIKIGSWYNLYDEKENKTLLVLPFDGDDIGEAGLSHGFIHYITSEAERGFCGIGYFEKNAIIKK